MLADFRKLWGTTTVAGTKVLHRRRYFYPHNLQDDNLKKLARQLGFYDSLQAGQSGVASAWLYLNPFKADNIVTAGNISDLEYNLRLAVPERTKKVYNPDTGGYDTVDDSYFGGTVILGPKTAVIAKKWTTITGEADIVSPLSDQAAVCAEVTGKYPLFWNSNYTIISAEDDPYKNILLLYSLLVPGAEGEIIKVEKYKETDHSFKPSLSLYHAYALTVKVKRPTNVLAAIIANKVLETTSGPSDELKTTEKGIKQLLEKFFLDGGDTLDSDWPAYRRVSKSVGSDWLRHDGAYYLKESFLDSSSMSNENKVSYLMSVLDSDYKKKKQSWYNKFLAVVIIIGAVIIAGPAGGAAALAVGGGIWGAIAFAAVTLTVAALYVQVIATLGQYIGAEGVGTVMADTLRRNDKLLAAARIVSTVVGIQIAINAAMKAAGTSLLEASASEIFKSFLSTFTGYSSSNTALVNTLKLTNFALNEYNKYEDRKFDKSMDKKYQELQKLQELSEQTMVSDVLKDYIRMEPKVLAAADSEYASLYDRPYEKWSTQYHSGNIQANSVSAFWTSMDV